MTIRVLSQIEYLRQNFSKLADTCVPLWHPLGFISCQIRNEPGYCTARIHYWPKGERRPKQPDWPIHTHAYDLSSLVLIGRVRDMQYRERKGSQYTVYAVSYVGDDSSIVSTGRTLAIETCVDQYHAQGEEYRVPIGSFHQTYVSKNESAVTIVALSNFQRTDPLVLGHPSRESYPYARMSFDKDIFWKRIDQAIGSLLEKSGPPGQAR